jgi:gamma-glutamyl:cysteine ligase YbdK (ATP-grasp superfamily)
VASAASQLLGHLLLSDRRILGRRLWLSLCMGEEVGASEFSREQRTRYRQRLLENLDDFDTYLATARFADDRSIGLEIELNLVDAGWQPALRNAAVLDSINDPGFQTEIGAYNIELNYPALSISGDGLARLESGLRERLNTAEERAGPAGAHILMTGILPTIRRSLLEDKDWMSPESRYAALNTSLLAARGEDVLLDIRGIEDLTYYVESISPEAACTSAQLHLQVTPDRFAAAWNASQIVAGPQVALAANSPTFAGTKLWHETRIELFGQAVDSRPPEMRNQGVRPRAWFGERWITSIFDLFEENVRYFPALLPELTEARKNGHHSSNKPGGGPPDLYELRLHNGTVWRWNRPIYDPHGPIPHLRVENRLLPAGPAVADVVANAAFYYGLVEVLQSADRPLWSRMAFSTAADNFYACARYGLDAQVYWPGVGDVPADELIVRHLLPLAADGLQRLGVDPGCTDRYIGILRDRAKTAQTGAQWQLDAIDTFEQAGLARCDAIDAMVQRYAGGMHANAPVHTWPIPEGDADLPRPT